MNFYKDQSVKYVNAEGQTVDATIEETNVSSDGAHARVRYGPKNVAIARFSDGKEPNTFHLPEGENAGSSETSTSATQDKAKPFKPGESVQQE